MTATFIRTTTDPEPRFILTLEGLTGLEATALFRALDHGAFHPMSPAEGRATPLVNAILDAWNRMRDKIDAETEAIQEATTTKPQSARPRTPA